MNNNEQAEEVVSKIQLSGAEAIAIQVDVQKIADVRRLFQKTIEHYGKVDILINNAAGTNVFKPTAIMSEEEYDSMFNITRGVYFALQEAAHRWSLCC